MSFEEKITTSSCVICHQLIDLSGFGHNNIILEHNYVGCPNGHLVHRHCLKQWIIHSKVCPLCHTKYELQIIQVYSDYLRQVEEDKRRAELEKQRLEEQRKLEEAKKDEFDPETLQKFNNALQMVENGIYDQAINEFWDIIDNKNYVPKDSRNLELLFHLGRTYYKMGKGTLGIRQLMKLVKLDFKYPLAFYYLGLCYEQIDLPAKARWAYDRSLRNLNELVQQEPHYKPFIQNIKERIQFLLSEGC